jgi:hypothetical protein
LGYNAANNIGLRTKSRVIFKPYRYDAGAERELGWTNSDMRAEHATRGLTLPLDSAAKTAILINIFDVGEVVAKDR